MIYMAKGVHEVASKLNCTESRESTTIPNSQNHVNHVTASCMCVNKILMDFDYRKTWIS
jgi:hypothetical protein